MYKLLVLDFDDTLLDDNLTVSPGNLNAIVAAMEKGVYVVFNSGRSNDSMIKFIERLNIHDDHEYFASFNGARLDTVGGENIFLKCIEGPILKKLIDYGNEYDLVVQFYDNGMVVEKDSETVQTYVKLTNIDYRIMSNIYDLKQSVKVLFNSQDIEKLNRLKARIETELEGQVNVFFSKPTYLEVLNIEANKGLVVKYLAEILNIKQEEIIAVGDSFNDIYMIEYAGLGVAVKNAKEDVKKFADYITKTTNNEDAIKEVIEKFILN
jgi:Cof subfamily protein (haloacid dehalogenase superfamily)